MTTARRLLQVTVVALSLGLIVVGLWGHAMWLGLVSHDRYMSYRWAEFGRWFSEPETTTADLARVLLRPRSLTALVGFALLGACYVLAWCGRPDDAWAVLFVSWLVLLLSLAQEFQHAFETISGFDGSSLRLDILVWLIGVATAHHAVASVPAAWLACAAGSGDLRGSAGGPRWRSSRPRRTWSCWRWSTRWRSRPSTSAIVQTTSAARCMPRGWPACKHVSPNSTQSARRSKRYRYATRVGCLASSAMRPSTWPWTSESTLCRAMSTDHGDLGPDALPLMDPRPRAGLEQLVAEHQDVGRRVAAVEATLAARGPGRRRELLTVSDSRRSTAHRGQLV